MSKKPRKNFSISQRLTLFYTLGLSLLLLLLFIILNFFLSRSTANLSQNKLERIVKETANELSFLDNAIYVNENLNPFQEGVSLLIYKSNGELALGTLPQGFPEDLALITDTHRTIASDSYWNVYDIFVHFEGNGAWVRGIYSTDAAQAFYHNSLITMLIVFPIMALLIILFGHLITKKTLAPLKSLSQTINEINHSQDLKRRLPLEKTTPEQMDELELLSFNFNQMLDRLQEAFAREQEFTSNASHELRTPVAAILAQSKAALLPETSCQDKEKALEKIASQAQNMQSLLNQLLELTRADRGDLKVEQEEVDLSQLASMALELVTEQAQEKGIKLEAHLEENVLIQGDEILLLRLMVNLLNNAVKYGNPEGYVILDLKTADNDALLSVSDNGQGISAEEQKKIFDRFYRTSKSRTQAGEYSAGLGLSMVQWIVNAHGGSIEVHSTVKLGSQFVVKLPLTK